VIRGNFDAEGAKSLASAYRAASLTASSEGATFAPGAETPGAQVVSASADTVADAVTCLQTAFPFITGEPVRLIRARYLREPAYLGIYLVGPGADQPATRAVVYAADLRDCRAVGLSDAELGP
jgi:hypothetical protein